jgi:hypothetical protein
MSPLSKNNITPKLEIIFNKEMQDTKKKTRAKPTFVSG